MKFCSSSWFQRVTKIAQIFHFFPPCLCLTISLSLSQSIYIFFFFSFCFLSVFLFFYLSHFLFLSLSIYLSSIFPSFYLALLSCIDFFLSPFLSLCLSNPFLSLSIYFSISLSFSFTLLFCLPLSPFFYLLFIKDKWKNIL